MSGFFRCQVRLPSNTGLPEDDTVNVWHFDSDQTFAEDADDVAARLLTFYEFLDQYLSDQLTGAIQIKVYDLEDPEPRAPGYILDGTLTIPSALNYPREVALCLSMRGAIESGVNMRRRRGRVYLGPFNVAIGQTDAAGDVRPSSTQIGFILDAAQDLAVGPDAGDGRLAVYSPTTDISGTLADSFHDVVELKMDNAWDTMRSRGVKPSASFTRSVP